MSQVIVQRGWGGAGANAALSNLASVSINTSLFPQVGIDLGSAATPWRDVYLYGSGTFGSHSIKLTGTPTANRVISFPDVTGTLLTTAGSGTSLVFPGSLSIASGKTATFNNTLTLTATDGSTLAIGTGGTLGTAAYTAA